MVLRQAELSDVVALVDVQEAGAVLALAHVFPQDEYPFPRMDIRARWTAEIGDPGVDAYVIVDASDRVVGFAALRGDELLHFGTAVPTWGTGLAAVAHDELMARLAARGVTRARLRVFEENHRACRFYEKLGWRRTGKRTRTSFAPHPVLVEYQNDHIGRTV